jgi:hypothetical protein
VREVVGSEGPCARLVGDTSGEGWKGLAAGPRRVGGTGLTGKAVKRLVFQHLKPHCWDRHSGKETAWSQASDMRGPCRSRSRFRGTVTSGAGKWQVSGGQASGRP